MDFFYIEYGRVRWKNRIICKKPSFYFGEKAIFHIRKFDLT